MIRSPFTYGMVCSAPVIGALAGGSALNARGTILFALTMAVGAAVAVLACSWWPKLSAPVWKLWPASVAANPLFLLAAGYSLDHYECLPGSATGWNCFLVDLGPFVAALCLLPPIVGLALRWLRRQRAAKG